MLISRTPFRISFLGGGTDFEAYFNEYPGSVLSTTIDKYCYVTIRRLPEFFSYKNQFTYSKIERFNKPDEVEHPVLREAFKFLDVDRIQVAYDADLPARSGLGTSSAFAVGLLNGLHRYKNETISKMDLAKEAIYLEHELCREAGGVQDQIAVSFGGFNRIDFGPHGYKVRPVDMPPERKKELNGRLLLFFTGFTHHAGELSKEQTANIPARLSQLHEMKALVDEGETILHGRGDLREFGRLLHKTWELKRTLSDKITTCYVDDAYEKAMKAGALGGKLLGAGGGGFMLFYAEPEARESVRGALSDLLEVPYKFETGGSKIIYAGGD